MAFAVFGVRAERSTPRRHRARNRAGRSVRNRALPQIASWHYVPMTEALNIWPSFGFSKSPYDTTELRPDAEGSQLLVGRDAEVKALQRRWYSSTQITTIEGPVGAGKTSLAGVAAFRAMQARLSAGSDLIIPLGKTIQFESSTDDLKRKVLHEVAQTLLLHETTLKNHGHDVPNLNDLRGWMNTPVFKGGSIGFSPVSAGKSTPGANSTTGFSQSGLEQVLSDILARTFPPSGSGSLVCVIDNMELLQTAGAARDCLDVLRDDLFNLPGVRWVLVGATSIVRTAISIPRLSGKVSNPVPVGPVSDDYISELVKRRIDHYKTRSDYFAPVGPDDFHKLYLIVGRNLRETFKHSLDVAMWLADLQDAGKPFPLDPLESWIDTQGDFSALTSKMSGAAQEVFDRLTAADGGAISAADLADDPDSYQQKIRYRVRKLEEINLVETVGLDDDFRYKTVRLTALGWFTHHVRSRTSSRLDEEATPTLASE